MRISCKAPQSRHTSKIMLCWEKTTCTTAQLQPDDVTATCAFACPCLVITQACSTLLALQAHTLCSSSILRNCDVHQRHAEENSSQPAAAACQHRTCRLISYRTCCSSQPSRCWLSPTTQANKNTPLRKLPWRGQQLHPSNINKKQYKYCT